MWTTFLWCSEKGRPLVNCGNETLQSKFTRYSIAQTRGVSGDNEQRTLSCTIYSHRHRYMVYYTSFLPEGETSARRWEMVVPPENIH